MSLVTAFKINRATGQTIVPGALAVLIPGVATAPRRMRLAWSGGPGFFALGPDGTAQRSLLTTERISLTEVAGSQIFELGSDQNYIDSTIAVSLNLGV